MNSSGGGSSRDAQWTHRKYVRATLRVKCCKERKGVSKLRNHACTFDLSRCWWPTKTFSHRNYGGSHQRCIPQNSFGSWNLLNQGDILCYNTKIKAIATTFNIPSDIPFRNYSCMCVQRHPCRSRSLEQLNRQIAHLCHFHCVD